MENNEIDNDDVARDLAYHCLDMIRFIYHLDYVKDCNLENDFYFKVKTSIKRALKDIEERLNSDNERRDNGTDGVGPNCSRKA